MTISIWRYSHLTLAIFSTLFIIIASLTGVILAFEPISKKLKPFDNVNIDNVSISETIKALETKYDEIISIEIDKNNFITASIINNKGKSETFYINPKTGNKIGETISKTPIFDFATNLHRSLFLKSTGRFIVGFVSFLLFIISITGIILISKRQGGFLNLFSKIVKEDFNQYYHIVFGRYFLIPIIIITLTGIYLSLEKFNLLPKDKNKHQKNLALTKDTPNIKSTDFDFFKATKLANITKIEFPFSTDKEDYFYIKSIKNEFAIHQFNGQIVSQKKHSLTTLGSYYSLILHTGQGSVLWSIILLLACFTMLFFIFSGFSITLKRKKKTSKIKNKYHKDNAEFIILVGSETGSTFNFALAFYKSLLNAHKTVFITELNNYTTYKNAKTIIVFAATYGDGEAPVNASKFLTKLKKITQKNNIQFSVIGFGSKDYKAFCQFAILVHSNMQIHKKFIPVLPIYKINNQSFTSFKKWLNEWNSFYKLDLNIEKESLQTSKNNEQKFTILNKTKKNIDDTFLIELKPSKKVKFSSGDLLSITPKNEIKNRLYSIAKVDKNILLSIKKHEFGICSNFLNDIKRGDNFLASIQKNENFYFPKYKKEVILIANGTGIAPFLGMISQNKKGKIHLFWGERTKESYNIYQKFIENHLKKGQLTSFNSVFSQEQKEKIYVQDILTNYSNLILKTLEEGNTIMICGSLKMQQSVKKKIRIIINKKLNTSLESFEDNKQIKYDCY
ncbi:MAG: PepSY domain-containing protein [Polaribacter sp.]|uniref:PepSY domain-containing protein n=1 Tax=Polaribacter sp. TaxID=1920175 RepID=UPI003266DE88